MYLIWFWAVACGASSPKHDFHVTDNITFSLKTNNQSADKNDKFDQGKAVGVTDGVPSTPVLREWADPNQEAQPLGGTPSVTEDPEKNPKSDSNDTKKQKTSRKFFSRSSPKSKSFHVSNSSTDLDVLGGTKARMSIERSNSLRSESKPTIKESKPTTKESKPTTKESKPTIKESKPTIKESKPTIKESKPTIKESKPTIKESKPTIKTSSKDNPKDSGADSDHDSNENDEFVFDENLFWTNYKVDAEMPFHSIKEKDEDLKFTLLPPKLNCPAIVGEENIKRKIPAANIRQQPSLINYYIGIMTRNKEHVLDVAGSCMHDVPAADVFIETALSAHIDKFREPEVPIQPNLQKGVMSSKSAAISQSDGIPQPKLGEVQSAMSKALAVALDSAALKGESVRTQLDPGVQLKSGKGKVPSKPPVDSRKADILNSIVKELLQLPPKYGITDTCTGKQMKEEATRLTTDLHMFPLKHTPWFAEYNSMKERRGNGAVFITTLPDNISGYTRPANVFFALSLIGSDANDILRWSSYFKEHVEIYLRNVSDGRSLFGGFLGGVNGSEDNPLTVRNLQTHHLWEALGYYEIQLNQWNKYPDVFGKFETILMEEIKRNGLLFDTKLGEVDKIQETVRGNLMYTTLEFLSRHCYAENMERMITPSALYESKWIQPLLSDSGNLLRFMKFKKKEPTAEWFEQMKYMIKDSADLSKAKASWAVGFPRINTKINFQKDGRINIEFSACHKHVSEFGKTLGTSHEYPLFETEIDERKSIFEHRYQPKAGATGWTELIEGRFFHNFLRLYAQYTCKLEPEHALFPTEYSIEKSRDDYTRYEYGISDNTKQVHIIFKIDGRTVERRFGKELVDMPEDIKIFEDEDGYMIPPSHEYLKWGEAPPIPSQIESPHVHTAEEHGTDDIIESEAKTLPAVELATASDEKEDNPSENTNPHSMLNPITVEEEIECDNENLPKSTPELEQEVSKADEKLVDTNSILNDTTRLQRVPAEIVHQTEAATVAEAIVQSKGSGHSISNKNYSTPEHESAFDKKLGKKSEHLTNEDLDNDGSQNEKIKLETQDDLKITDLKITDLKITPTLTVVEDGHIHNSDMHRNNARDDDRVNEHTTDVSEDKDGNEKEKLHDSSGRERLVPVNTDNIDSVHQSTPVTSITANQTVNLPSAPSDPTASTTLLSMDPDSGAVSSKWRKDVPIVLATGLIVIIAVPLVFLVQKFVRRKENPLLVDGDSTVTIERQVDGSITIRINFLKARKQGLISDVLACSSSFDESNNRILIRYKEKRQKLKYGPKNVKQFIGALRRRPIIREEYIAIPDGLTHLIDETTKMRTDCTRAKNLLSYTVTLYPVSLKADTDKMRQVDISSENGGDSGSDLKLETLITEEANPNPEVSSGLGKSNSQTSNVQRSNVQRSNVQTSNVQRSNVQTSNVQRSNVQRSNVQTSNVQRSNVQRSNVQTSNVQRSNVQRSNLQTPDTRMLKLKRSNSRTSNPRTSNSETSSSQTSSSQTSNSRTSNSRTSNSRTSNSRTSNSQSNLRTSSYFGISKFQVSDVLQNSLYA